VAQKAIGISQQLLNLTSYASMRGIRRLEIQRFDAQTQEAEAPFLDYGPISTGHHLRDRILELGIKFLRTESNPTSIKTTHLATACEQFALFEIINFPSGL
jgi:hypothetical protein